MKKNIILLIALVFGLLVVVLLAKDSGSKNPLSNDWMIIPSERIGPLIRKNLTEQNTVKNIQDAFGLENIKETEFSIGEGETILGFSIYHNTENEIEFHVNNKGVLFKFPSYNSYFYNNPDLSSQIKWEISNGVKIGSSISEVQKINGKVFELSGFEWDYPGVVSAWLDGKLPSELSIVFRQTATEIPTQYEQITGDKIISSDNSVLQKTNPVVNFIYIKWDFK